MDDLRGQSCTPITMAKADFAKQMLRDHCTLLKEGEACSPVASR